MLPPQRRQTFSVYLSSDGSICITYCADSDLQTIGFLSIVVRDKKIVRLCFFFRASRSKASEDVRIVSLLLLIVYRLYRVNVSLEDDWFMQYADLTLLVNL